MDIAAVTLWIFAIVLVVFGLAFVSTGLVSERGYWSQRDPHGDARQDATKLPTIIRTAFKLSVGEVRAPLRIAAIGVVLIYVALVFGVVALIVSVFNA
jgi:putative Mn2+ efflux pump MntP